MIPKARHVWNTPLSSLFVQVLITEQLKSFNNWNHLNFFISNCITASFALRPVHPVPFDTVQTWVFIVGDVQLQLKVQAAAIEEVNGTRSLTLSQSSPDRLLGLDVVHLIVAPVRHVF